MPTYDYRCETDGQVYEVNHRMSEHLKTWGELCEKTGIAPGDINLDSPVTKLATGGNVVKSGSMGSGPDLPPCATGGCGGGMCGLN